MAMTVGELIMELESYDENMEVRLAQQPSWAFEYSIGQVGASDPGELTDAQHCEVRTMTEGDREEAESEGKDFDYDESWERNKAEALLDNRSNHDGEATECVYIGEGQQLGYLPTCAAQAIGWGRDQQ